MGGHQVGLSATLSHLFSSVKMEDGALSLQNQSIKGKTNALYTEQLKTRKSGSDGWMVVHKVEVVLISHIVCVFFFLHTAEHITLSLRYNEFLADLNT